MAQEPDALALHLTFLRSYDAAQFAQADSTCRAGGLRFPADAARAWLLADSAVSLNSGETRRTYARAEATIHVATVLARGGLMDSARRTLSRIPDSLAVDPTHVLGYHKALAWRMAGDTAESRRQLERYLEAVPARQAEFANGGGWWFAKVP